MPTRSEMFEDLVCFAAEMFPKYAMLTLPPQLCDCEFIDRDLAMFYQVLANLRQLDR